MTRAALIALLLTTSAQAATPVTAAWPTWLRAAPDPNARVLDELQAGQTLTALNCENGWCRVLSGGAPGYVPEQLLAAGPAPGLLPAQGDCLATSRFTPEGPVAERICPATRR